MAIWDSASNFLSGGARDDMNDAYNNANNYARPYATGGFNNFRQAQEYLNNWNPNTGVDPTAGYGNPADTMWKSINQSPTDYYGNIMRSYSQSPTAKYEQEQAIRASNAGAAASGMLGSGSQLKELQQNAADIASRDQQRYFDDIMGVNRAQMGALENFQGQKNQFQNRQDQQQQQFRQMLEYLTSLGFDANNIMAGNEINRGNSNAKYDQGAIQDIEQLLGAGISGGYNSFNKMPAYMLAAGG